MEALSNIFARHRPADFAGPPIPVSLLTDAGVETATKR